MPDTRNFAVCLPDPPVPASAPKGQLSVNLGDVTVMTTQTVVPPCQPCIAINGVVDPDAFIALIDGTPQVMNLNGPIAGTVEYLDETDPRCAPEPIPCPDDLCTIADDLCCDCTTGCPDCDPATVAASIGGVL